jgi:cytochrome c-type biogenesis protein CcmH/NrfF
LKDKFEELAINLIRKGAIMKSLIGFMVYWYLRLVLNNSRMDQITCPACQSENITKKISTIASRLASGNAFSFLVLQSSDCSSGSV